MIIRLSSSGRYVLYIDKSSYNVFDLDKHCIVCHSEDPLKVLELWRDKYYSGFLPRSKNNNISYNFDC